MRGEVSEELGLILQRLDEIERLLLGINASPWMNAKEGANFLRISPSTLDALVKKGLIPCRRLNPENPKSQRLFHRRDLVAFLVCGHDPQTHRLSPSEKKMIDALL